MAKPLGLPVGSVRALLLLALTARGVLDLRGGRGVEPWLAVAVLVSGAAYFAARASRRGMAPLGLDAPRPRDPLGLPGGTIRTLFLLGLGYGTWLWLRDHDLDGDRGEVAAVVIAFLAGVLLRWVLARVPRPPDVATRTIEHAQAFVALLCSAGLVAIGVTGVDAAWSDPLLAAVCTYYAGAR
jgi:hypothetical protein